MQTGDWGPGGTCFPDGVCRVMGVVCAWLPNITHEMGAGLAL
jgi:hypothetical protein